MSQSAKGRRTRSKAALRKLGQIPIMNQPAEDYVAQLRNESDRGAIVLMAGFIEDTIDERLREVLLSADPRLDEKLFGSSGILATFGSKVTMLVALGQISPSVGAMVDHVRLVRNAAAHVTADVNFASAEMRDAVGALLDDPSQGMVEEATPSQLRDIFVLACILLQQIAGDRAARPEADDVRRSVVGVAAAGIDRNGGLPFSVLYTARPLNGYS